MRLAPVGLAAITLASCSGSTKTYRIPSSAMEPTLHCARPGFGCEGRVEDRIRVRLTKSVQRGDIVVFQTPRLAEERCGAGGKYVKRVVGMPGETWAEKDGYVYVNGRRLRERYIKRSRRDTQTFDKVRLGKNEFFLLGDNRYSSCDSRVWGPVPRANIVGKVVTVLRGSKKISIKTG